MSVYRIFIFCSALYWLNGCVVAKPAADKELLQTTEKVFAQAGIQYKLLAASLPPGKFPKNYDPNKEEYEWSNADWWCSGFYPGSLIYLYEETDDKALYDQAKEMLERLQQQQYNTGTHDLGFMMYCSFGNANRLEPGKEYRKVLLNSARSLATRFNPLVGCIRSWNSDSSDFVVIIDNMMNLELLFWATRETGDSSFYNIAVTHANTTLKNHFRTDNSSYHVVNYDPRTGKVKQKRTAQGYGDESAWARGQAWGLYGFAMMYRETGNRVYLEQAKKIADFILNHPDLPADKIPYWDFNAPGIPNALRDASAAAIMASALLELQAYCKSKLSSKYLKTAEQIIRTLSSDTYLAPPGTNGGFILKHGVGHLPAGTEVDVALTYADYYFIEALKRYKALK
jgi:hypothetical protein